MIGNLCFELSRLLCTCTADKRARRPEEGPLCGCYGASMTNVLLLYLYFYLRALWFFLWPHRTCTGNLAPVHILSFSEPRSIKQIVNSFHTGMLMAISKLESRDAAQNQYISRCLSAIQCAFKAIFFTILSVAMGMKWRRIWRHFHPHEPELNKTGPGWVRNGSCSRTLTSANRSC